MKKLILTFLAIMSVCMSAHARYLPQYAAVPCDGDRGLDAFCIVRCDSACACTFQDSFFTGAEARARAAVMKRTGTALLISGGVLSTTGVALYGAAIASLDHDLGTAGLAVTGASLPFYIAGAILHVKGKKGMLEAAPGTLCLRF